MVVQNRVSELEVVRKPERGLFGRIRSGWSTFCMHINENPQNWIPVFALIACMFFTVFVRNDSDMWFLIANGREILEHGFPHEDYMSMHEGFHYVLQQWTVCVVDAWFYDTFGEAGLAFWVVCANIICMLVMGWAIYLKSNDWSVVCWLGCLGMLVLSWVAATPRPMIYSAISVLLLAACFEMWKRTHSGWWCIAVIGISLFQANTHATFWPATLAMLCLYVIVWFIFNKEYKGRFEWLGLWVFTTIGFIVAGFANPYGYESIGQIFYTLGYSDVYSTIIELQPIRFETFCLWALPLLIAAWAHCGNVTVKDMPALGWADGIMTAITLFASLIAARSVLFFIVCAVLFIADLPSSYVGIERMHDKNPVIGKVLIAALATLAVSFFIVHTESFDGGSYGSDEQKTSFEELDDHFSGEDVSGATFLSTDITHGQYLYAKYGMRPFIDARLETHLLSVNGKDDTFRRYTSSMEKGASGICEIVNDYGCEYVIVTDDDVANELPYELLYRGNNVAIFRS